MATKKAAKAVKPKTPRAPKLTHDEAVYATVNVFGKKFTSVGATPIEAILNLTPGVVRGKVILTLERNGKKQDRVLTPIMASRAFNTRGSTRQILVKNLSLLFAV